MTKAFTKLLKIKEPGGIQLGDQKELKDRASIDIGISRSNLIEFPWENTIGDLPDDMDAFREGIKNSLDLEKNDWEKIDLRDLIYEVKENDRFYYTLVEWFNSNNDDEPRLSPDSKALIYNKLNKRYYEPYYTNQLAEVTVYTLFTKENFSSEQIQETFKKITHLRAVFPPKSPDLTGFETDLRIERLRTNPITGGFLNMRDVSFPAETSNSGGVSSMNLLNSNSSSALNTFLSYRNRTISQDSANYISGNQVKLILDMAKSSHSKPEADPIKDVVKRVSTWKAEENVEFFVAKENLNTSLSIAQMDLMLTKSSLDDANMQLFYDKMNDDNAWVGKLNNRYYWLELERDDANFDTVDSFFNSWESNITDITLIAYKKNGEELTNTIPSNKYFDITLSAIIDAYREILAKKDFSESRKTLSKSLLNKVNGLADFDYEDFKEAISSIEDKHNTLINANNDILREERILKERLKKFGYEIRGSELGNVQIFQRYSVMRLIRKVYRFSRRIRIRVGWFRRIRVTRWYTRYRYLWIRVKKERLITVPETPWSDEVDKLKENGYTVHFLELTNQGYISDSGESLNDIMTECEISEAIRLKTAVMIPQYEQSLTKGLRLIGYELFSRPVAGDVPTSIPDLSLEENLAYRAAWKGVELSELIESINLAPGETRNINIKQSFTSEKTQVQSITTILDVTEKQSTTFTDFFEQTNRKTKETVTNKKWSAKAGGSFGAFKAGGSAGGSTRQTNKSFAQQIKRAANESSREMKRQSRVEINSKLTESSKLVIDESISSQIQNINDGVSLNLFFYRLDNVYQGGLHLEGLKLIYTRPVPLIKGTEIQDIRTFEFYEFEEFLDMITRDSILVLSASLNDIELELKEIEIRFSIVFKVFKKIFKEYFYNVPEDVFIEYPEPIQKNDLLISGESIDANRVSGPLSALMASIEKQKESYTKVCEKLDTYISDDKTWWKEYREVFQPLNEIQDTIEKTAYQLLNSIEYGLVPISGAHLFSIPSNGAYLDCVIGSSSGLEQYSEDMRTQELNRRKAEIALMNAQTLKVHSQGVEALYEISSIKISNIGFEDGEPVIFFNKELPNGNWIGEINGTIYHGQVKADRKSFVINNWESESGPMKTIKIIDSSNGVYFKKVFQVD